MLATIASACSDNLDIKQSYEFKVTHLPVPKKLKVNETAEVRGQLERSGEYDDGTVFLPNDTYELTKETFRLYYTSLLEDLLCRLGDYLPWLVDLDCDRD